MPPLPPLSFALFRSLPSLHSLSPPSLPLLSPSSSLSSSASWNVRIASAALRSTPLSAYAPAITCPVLTYGNLLPDLPIPLPDLGAGFSGRRQLGCRADGARG
eukprot:2356570-Rhodomonas_salina.1